jgi:hypothetical protein
MILINNCRKIYRSGRKSFAKKKTSHSKHDFHLKKPLSILKTLRLKLKNSGVITNHCSRKYRSCQVVSL